MGSWIIIGNKTSLIRGKKEDVEIWNGQHLDQSIMLEWISDWIIQKRGLRERKKMFKNKLMTATNRFFSKIRSSLNQDSITQL